VESFELPWTAVEGKGILRHTALLAMSQHVARERLRVSGDFFVEFDDCFGSIHFADEDDSVGRNRFIRSFESVDWSSEARSLIDLVHGWTGDRELSAVHVRAGDNVTGRYRQRVVLARYAPTPYVELAIEQLSGPEAAPVLVTSDNLPYLTWLRQHHRNVLTASDLIPNYGELPEMLRSFADILLLSRCSTIVGPGGSAFSSLAAILGCGHVTAAYRLSRPGEERTVLQDGIRKMEGELVSSPFLAGLVARDIVWYLDVFGDEMPLIEQLDYARRAVQLDSDLGCARSRVALIEALLGDSKGSLRAVTAAIDMAGSVEDLHPDAMFEALATGIAVVCSTSILESSRTRSTRWRSRLRLPLTRRGLRRRRVRLAVALAQVRRGLARLAVCQTWEMDRDGVQISLQRLEAILLWLSEANDDVLRRVERGLSRWKSEDLDISLFRPSTLDPLRANAFAFDAVVDHIERTVIHLSLALGLRMGAADSAEH
jgi:hypothetical protein